MIVVGWFYESLKKAGVSVKRIGVEKVSRFVCFLVFEEAFHTIMVHFLWYIMVHFILLWHYYAFHTIMVHFYKKYCNKKYVVIHTWVGTPDRVESKPQLRRDKISVV